jgi:hypothetical protein
MNSNWDYTSSYPPSTSSPLRKTKSLIFFQSPAQRRASWTLRNISMHGWLFVVENHAHFHFFALDSFGQVNKMDLIEHRKRTIESAVNLLNEGQPAT